MMRPSPTSRTAGSVGSRRDAVTSTCPNPVRLDCGRELHPVRIAYETYGTLSPARDNVDPRLPRAQRRRARGRLHADAGRAEHARRLRRRRPRRRGRQGPRLVGRHDRPRQGVRHRPLLRRLHQPARRLPRHDRAVVDRPGDRQAVRARTSRSSPSPTWCAPSARSSTSSASSGSRPWPAARSAGCRRSSGRSSTPTRSTPSSRSPARTPSSRRAGVERDRARRDHGRPGRGRAATTTARATRRTPAWASRG